MTSSSRDPCLILPQSGANPTDMGRLRARRQTLPTTYYYVRTYHVGRSAAYTVCQVIILRALQSTDSGVASLLRTVRSRRNPNNIPSHDRCDTR